MSRFQEILVAIDRSDFARTVLDRASQFARLLDADLRVVHVAEIPAVLPLADEGTLGRERWFDPGDLRGEAREGVIARVRETAAGAVDPEIVVRSGLPAEEILLEAAERNADLIVIGTHGRRGLSRLFLGSVAEKVCSRAPCPVLTVLHDPRAPSGPEAPLKLETPPLRRILVTTDLSERSLDAVPTAVEIASRSGGAVAVLTVLEDPVEHPEIDWRERAGITPEELKAHCAEHTRAKIAALLADRGVEPIPRLEIGYGSPAATIVDRIASEGHDLVVLASRGQGGWLGAILGSVARSVVRAAPCPVLILR